MSKRRLLHYSSDLVLAPRDFVQDASNLFKPVGTWVSCEGDDDWASWCEAEDFGIGDVAHEVFLSDRANILHLMSIHEIDMFTEQWTSPTARPYSYSTILWPCVAEEYDGIIISPYQWERRLHDGANWYYSWDCASGCIWNASAIEAIEILEASAPAP